MRRVRWYTFGFAANNLVILARGRTCVAKLSIQRQAKCPFRVGDPRDESSTGQVLTAARWGPLYLLCAQTTEAVHRQQTPVYTTRREEQARDDVTSMLLGA